MGFTLREIDAECKFSQAMTVEALARAIPQRAIHGALTQHGSTATRERKLTLALTVWLVIALHLYPTVAIAGVLRKLAPGLRFLWPDPSLPLPGDSALA
jgi:Insertion element 4 transposase N-terminal